MYKDFNLKEKLLLITGGTRGIGAAIAEVFVKAGADIIITGTQKDSVQKKVKELRMNAIGEVDGWVADFTVQESLDSICRKIRTLPVIHILINNAGMNHIFPIDEINTEDLDAIYALNLRTPAILSREVAHKMKAQGWGRILNIASIWSVITKPGRAMYSSSKFGLVGLTKATAVDLAPENVLVNALSPGFTLTELTRRSLSDDEQEQLAKQVPIKRFAEPQEMAKVALFLCSDLNSYITGQNIVVDGGFVSV
jgi:3-oxoacyl-[acyl-carrier protein] reductase